MKAPALRFLGELYEYRNVLWQLVVQQLVLRYRRTTLGYLWTLVNPLLMMSVMAVVFSTLFKADLKNFAIFLFAGMIPWNYFNSVVTQSSLAFIHNEGLIKKIYLPKALFPLSVALALLIDSVLSFFALFLIIILLGSSLTFASLLVPLAYVSLFFFSLGIGLITSVATVFFRDLQYVMQIGMQGLFFLTPILYRHDALAGKVGWVVSMNPVVPFVEIFRAALYHGIYPGSQILINAVAISLVTFVVGLFVFLRYEKRIVFRL